HPWHRQGGNGPLDFGPERVAPDRRAFVSGPRGFPLDFAVLSFPVQVGTADPGFAGEICLRRIARGLERTVGRGREKTGGSAGTQSPPGQRAVRRINRPDGESRIPAGCDIPAQYLSLSSVLG